MVYALIAVGTALVFLIAVILIRTLLFRPTRTPIPTAEPIEFDADAAVDALAQLVRCRTVSRRARDDGAEDEGEFERLYELLPTLYPRVFEVCKLTRLPDRALLFRWRGKNDGEPAVLMAHYDVVPADEQKWEKPPFCGEIADGVLWGRGSLDTKVTFNGILFSANHLIGEGYVPQNDIYFAFSGGEEVNGEGALHIVNYFKERAITPAFVLDEGGAVVENVFPGVKSPSAMIGIAEKGILDVEYLVKSNGGHASAPGPHTPVGVLSAAAVRVESHPFPTHLTPPVSAMFNTLVRHSSFLYRMIFANLWLFYPVLDLLCKRMGGELNALMRTTVAFTQMKGSDASNVIPPEATMVSNLRLNPTDTVASALRRLERTIGNKDVKLRVLHSMEPSRISATDTAGYRKVTAAIAKTWRGALITPYLMVQCSDSRHYGAISDRVYRFSAMDLTAEERQSIHGNNERIRLDCVRRANEFFIRLIKTC
ncbi:MAG: M20/M25/M40 family metallo-hydrolase [Clostridia bacterium]|nr:M20/M25/M40 family metallo-hydrolase [Clostridia bacterium]